MIEQLVACTSPHLKYTHVLVCQGCRCLDHVERLAPALAEVCVVVSESSQLVQPLLKDV